MSIGQLRAAFVLGLLTVWAFAWEMNALLGGDARGELFGKTTFLGAMVVAALLCIAGGLARDKDRVAWVLIGAGCLSWVAGEVYYQTILVDLPKLPVPSTADVGYLAFYPMVFAGGMMLLRSRSRRANIGRLLDGLTAALAVAALAAATALDTALGPMIGAPLAVATDLAYPLGDLLLLGMVTGAVVITGLRAGRRWAFIGVGISLFCLADVLYLFASAHGAYHLGIWFDILWPVGMIALAIGAWSNMAAFPVGAERNRTLSSGQIVAPMLFGVVSIGLLVYGSTPVNPWCRTLAAASLTVVLVRLAITFRDYAQAVEKREREAMTDALTGLANRRALTADLETLVRDLRADEPTVLTILDLDGFKAYNDTFGHPAGDAMLVRLSAKLATSVAGRGRAYRMGGDEFCVIARCASGETADATQRAAAALSEDGEGFSVRSSFGAVRMPAEAHTAETALQTADQRMYDSKGLVRSSAQGQSRAVLVAALTERTPELSSHTRGVRELAEAVARRLGMNPGEIDVVGNTADLHDIGKIAIPRAILDKPGPLDEGDWSLMRGHTVIGERIVGAAPALADVAGAVRASHERWDGAGYPDGLVGEMTPLAARIVCVCDAFDAMIADRPYASPRTTDEAVEELRRCSGTQFDPAVVQAFCTTIADRARTPPGIASSADQALTHGFSDR